MSVETVTVRMSRSDQFTPWGFCLQGGREFNSILRITSVTPDSLADRAGLQHGDVVVELAGRNAVEMDHEESERAISQEGNNLDLVVQRTSSAHIWKPTVTPLDEDSTVSKFQHTVRNPTEFSVPVDRQVKVSLEHQGQYGAPVPGYNTAARPFVSESKSVNLQYNSPIRLYSPSKAAEQYLQQTGDYFFCFLPVFSCHFRPNLNKPKADEPSYLKSATLRLIQETEQQGRCQGQPDTLHQADEFQQSDAYRRLNDAMATTNVGSNLSSRLEGTPVCYICGRNILGVFCNVAGKTLHGDCFCCSTCGSSLKNVGHVYHNSKFYCQVHGDQLRRMHFGSMPPIEPDAFQRRSIAPTQPPRTQEPIRAFYQPDILARGPIRLSPTPWKTPSPISPSARGVPKTPAMYGADLKTEWTRGGLGGGCSPKEQLSPQGTQNWPSNGANTKGGLSPGLETAGGASQPLRGRGVLKQLHEVPRVPICHQCSMEIRGPFVLAMGQTWCPDHFRCSNCAKKLLDIGFVEEQQQKYCEVCFEQFLAPRCAKCCRSIIGDCLNAIQKKWHPDCFVCTHCRQTFGNSAFFLENGQPFCERDWNELFTTKCVSCKFPIEAGDRWVEAVGSAYHSDCFKCTMCHKNLEGQSFYAKGGLPYCKAHA